MHYKGTKWQKCDLHLHTSSSSCFEDKKNSPLEFVQKAIDANLECIAVTDHNSGSSIDAIKEAAKGTGLVVFPGVEVTCSDAKVHLLLLFDTDKTTQDIEDHLIALGLQRDKFGRKDAHIHREVHEVAKESHDAGALVIPAHVDEFNGISAVANESKKKLFEYDFITSAQIVHKQLLDINLNVDRNVELLDYLNEYYDSEIPVETVKQWKSCASFIGKKALLTFSDNPAKQGSSKHGLWGVGSKYTWLKMDSNPNLESLRQALLVPKLRVRNFFDSVERPYHLPKTWIKSLYVEKTSVTAQGEVFKVEFSPQMTSIIGGRGSGKSSVLKFIRGVFDKTKDISKLGSIYEEFKEFYKQTDNRGMGVFKKESILTVEIMLNEQLYKVVVGDIVDSKKRTTSIFRLETATNKWLPVEEEEFLGLFQLDVYSQKQIYEIAQFPNALLERVDSAIPVVSDLRIQIEERTASYLSTCAQIREYSSKLAEEGKLRAEIVELETQVKSYKTSGIEELLAKVQLFAKDRETIETFSQDIHDKQLHFDELLKNLVDIEFDQDLISDIHKDEIGKLTAEANAGLKQVRTKVGLAKKKLKEIAELFDAKISDSEWQKSYKTNEELVDTKKEELSQAGVENIDGFESLLGQLKGKRKFLATLSKVRETILQLQKEKTATATQIIELRKQITKERREFLASILEGQNVKISVDAFRDRDNFESALRSTTQRGTGFDNGFQVLMDKTFNGNVLNKLQEVRQDLAKMRVGDDVMGYDGYFRNLIRDLSDEQFDLLNILLPEDQIQASYRSSEKEKFRNISNASAGQKTSTILTFILSHGTTPLILDQPEDDLDNHLVYGLIVDRLRKTKLKRQIVVVTHNANIPVNGDAEYIIAMNSESKFIAVLQEGTIEEEEIKREICDVMEGGVTAFMHRSQRYNNLKGLE